MGVDKKTQVIRADTRFSPLRALHQKPSFPRAHLLLFIYFIFLCNMHTKSKIMLRRLSQANSLNIYHQPHQNLLTTIKNHHHPPTKLQISVAEPLLDQIKQRNTKIHHFPSSSALPSMSHDNISQKVFLAHPSNSKLSFPLRFSSFLYKNRLFFLLFFIST
jgi:hypothetical protein